MTAASQLRPPADGPGSNPALYGVAEGLRSLFQLPREEVAAIEEALRRLEGEDPQKPIAEQPETPSPR